MKANPGGQLSPDQIVGRDILIESLWRILDRQSLVLAAERRLGKTSILKKMVAAPRSGWKPVFRDLERVRTPLEFVEVVVQDAEAHLSRTKRTSRRLADAVHALAGIELGGLIKLPPQAAPAWKTLLGQTIEALCEEASDESRVVFFWDEVPLMLHNIKTTSGEGVAMEILDTLRSLRQSHEHFRVVFTGSIGLHNVLTSLKRAGYANDPTNDMDTVDVPALDHGDAVQLAADLITGEGLVTRDLDTTAEVIATQVDCLPYYIHHVVDHLAKRREEASPARVTDVVTRALTSPQDPWHLRYYHERIDTYYLPGERTLARRLLDRLALGEPMSFKALLDPGDAGEAHREEVRRLLDTIQRDHYVVQDADGRYRFRFPLIRRHWRLHRGLSD